MSDYLKTNVTIGYKLNRKKTLLEQMFGKSNNEHNIMHGSVRESIHYAAQPTAATTTHEFLSESKWTANIAASSLSSNGHTATASTASGRADI